MSRVRALVPRHSGKGLVTLFPAQRHPHYRLLPATSPRRAGRTRATVGGTSRPASLVSRAAPAPLLLPRCQNTTAPDAAALRREATPDIGWHGMRGGRHLGGSWRPGCSLACGVARIGGSGGSIDADRIGGSGATCSGCAPAASRPCPTDLCNAVQCATILSVTHARDRWPRPNTRPRRA